LIPARGFAWSDRPFSEQDALCVGSVTLRQPLTPLVGLKGPCDWTNDPNAKALLNIALQYDNNPFPVYIRPQVMTFAPGPQTAVSDAYVNCTSSPADHALSWSQTVSSTTTVGVYIHDVGRTRKHRLAGPGTDAADDHR
jgi:hypothetical protein